MNTLSEVLPEDSAINDMASIITGFLKDYTRITDMAEREAYLKDAATSTGFDLEYPNFSHPARRHMALHYTVQQRGKNAKGTGRGQSNTRPMHIRSTITKGRFQSPIILDLDGDGVKSTSLEGGVHFDHEGDGIAEMTAWADRNDAFLVVDRNGNGEIDDGSELFGNNTTLSNGAKAANGFEALAEYDSNGDGRVDANDARWSELKLWRDANGNGVVDAGELLSMEDAGVGSLDIHYQRSGCVDENGNQHRQVGRFTRTDGSAGGMADVWMQCDQVLTMPSDAVGVPDDIAALPDALGFGLVGSLHQEMAKGNSALLSLVREYREAGDSEDAMRMGEDILYAWAQVPLAGSGANAELRRKLDVIEKFVGGTGYEWQNHLGNRDFSQFVDMTFDMLTNYTLASLRGQKYLANFFEDNVVSSLYFLLALTPSDLPEFGAKYAEFMTEANGAGFGLDTLMFLAGMNQSWGSDEENFIFGSIIDSMTRLKSGWAGLGNSGDIDLGSYGFINGTEERDVIAASSKGYEFKDVFIKGGAGFDTLYGGEANDILWGGDGGDGLVGNGGHDYISGGDGNDSINGGEGHDVLDGGDGNDTMLGGEGDDLLYGGEGDDILHGNDGNDILYGQAGNDKLYGGHGDDIMWGGAGDDEMVGGDGDDAYMFGRGDGHDIIRENSNDRTARRNVIQLGAGITPSDIEFLVECQNSYASHLIIRIKDTGETLTIDSGFNSGVDNLSSTHSIQAIVFENGLVWEWADILAQPILLAKPGTGYTAFEGSILHGTGGDDYLVGMAGNDTISGGAGNDRITGGDGNDILWGGAGDDTLEGGKGDDLYLFGRGDGHDIIKENSGELRADRRNVVRLGEGIGAGDIELLCDYKSGSNIDLIIRIKDTGETLTVQNGIPKSSTNIQHYFTIQAIEFADGSVWEWSDILAQPMQLAKTGSGYTAFEGSILHGTGGNDTLYGGQGDDSLLGGAGDDRVYGYGGNDVLHGGEGNDVLHGGVGDDTYLFYRGDGKDTVYESSGSDSLFFGGDIDVTDLWFSRSREGHLVIDVLGAEDTVTVNNHFSGDHYAVEKIVAGEYELAHTQMSQLIQAMAAFGTPQGVDGQWTDEQKEELAPILSSYWQPRS